MLSSPVKLRFLILTSAVCPQSVSSRPKSTTRRQPSQRLDFLLQASEGMPHFIYPSPFSHFRRYSRRRWNDSHLHAVPLIRFLINPRELLGSCHCRWLWWCLEYSHDNHHYRLHAFGSVSRRLERRATSSSPTFCFRWLHWSGGC